MVLEPPQAQALSIPAAECEESMPSLLSQKQRRRRRCRPTMSRLSAHRSAACSSPATERRSWKLPFLITITNAALIITTLLSIIFIPSVAAHGYLKTPRSRNLVAYQDMNYETPDSDDPKPEDCPHCLNRGGRLAQCGILFGTHEGEPWERNYDQPLTVRGEPMRSNIQGVYKEGAEIEVEVLVTTHHKGHFEFSVCPIDDTVPMSVPTEECFARNKLKFISDELYGAPQDPNHPERAYITPASKAEWSNGLPKEQPVVGAEYKMKFQLPMGVAGKVVLLQWYYLTANSCKHEGYADYPFPKAWGSDVTLYPGLPDCGEVPPDGSGVPEQFWNCAEIKVIGKGGQSTPVTTPNDDAGEEGMTTILAMTVSAADTTPPPASPPREAEETTHKVCADTSSSYFEATEDCTGYIYCMMGTPDKPYYCGDGMLYDEPDQLCNWPDQVTSCGGGGGQFEEDIPDWMPSTPRPTKTPTPQPTGKPNALLDWDPNVDRGHSKTIIGYYASWQWYDRDGVAAPLNMDFSKITRANFAFFQITPEGEIFGTDSWADPITLFGFYDWMAEEGVGQRYCSWDEPLEPPACSAHNYEEGLIYLAHKAGAEVYPSIGGWSLSDPFPVMAANAEARMNFASQCVKLIRNYNFDGIDLDWEYPGYEPHSGTEADTVNFNLLLDDVRAALDDLEVETGKFYGLTAALPCGPSIIANMDIGHVGKLLTELNLMTYDFHGSWNDKSGVNAPLYDQEGSPAFSVHGCVKNWLAGGAPKEKINIGFPFYGRSFLRAKNLYEAHEGNDDSTWHQDEGVPQYYNILKKMNEFTSVRDEQTMTQYAYGTTGMVSYDDERAICDKTEYAQVHDLNGYIIWELSGDLNDDLSTPLLDAANAKLLNPTMNCTSLDLSDSINALIGEAKPDGGGNGGASEIVFYPDFSNAKCLHDGLHSSWLQPGDMFNNAQGCCNKHFNWNDDCIQDSEADIPTAVDGQTSDGVLYYPSDVAHQCNWDGKQPEWVPMDSLHDNLEECCEEHYGWSQDCIANSIKQATATAPPATAPPVAATESFASPTLDENSASDELNASDAVYQVELDAVYRVEEFFPVFDGGITFCQNIGTPPAWMTGNFLKETKSECCQNYAFQWDYDKCLMGVASDAVAFASYTWEYRRHVFYPNFRDKSCLDDGNHPSWMAGDYLAENNWQCCNNGFHDDELLGECYTMPACADCPSDIDPYFIPEPAAAAAIETTATSATGQAVVETSATAATLSTTKASQPNAANYAATATSAAAAVESVLEANKDGIDNKILLYESPTMLWEPSSIYRFNDLLAALRVMYTDGVANKYFYMGDESQNGHLYGLVNIAAFLAQSMKETIKYNACDENSWDLVGGGYPLSNACGQLGQSYENYECAEHEKHMECPVKKDMEITATTNAKWWGAPAPLSCGPTEKYPFTGYWDHSIDCNNAWVDPPLVCDDYEGQKGGNFNNESPSPNSSGRTDVEGCCWWGRGVIQTTGVCNFGKLNYYLGARAAEEGRESRYPDINFCEEPDAICASQEHKELKWIAGLFYWVESLQSYNVDGWNYIDELKIFVDNGMSGSKFIDAVSGIVNRGCHNPPCASGGVDGMSERSSNFLKVLAELDLV